MFEAYAEWSNYLYQRTIPFGQIKVRIPIRGAEIFETKVGLCEYSEKIWMCQCETIYVRLSIL